MAQKVTIGIIGDGGWGSALAILLNENGAKVRLWGAFPEYVEEIRKTRENRKFLPGVKFPASIELHSDFKTFSVGCDYFLSAVPTVHLRKVMEKFQPHYPPGTPIISVTKGIEISTLQRPSEILRAALGKKTPVIVFSGPSHAEEVARGLPASVVAASESAALAKKVQTLFTSERFRVYAGGDPVGVELAAALKNVIAIAAGIVDGLELGDNAKAALVTRGLVEMARYGVEAGAKKETFYGLAGLGDLLTTCFSRHSRNRGVGEKIGRGEKLEKILAGTEMVAEGVSTVKAVYESPQKTEMPISQEIFHILFRNKDPRQAFVDLMRRAPKPEE